MQARQVTLAQLAERWTELSADYRPSAFWFWNAEMSEDQIESTVAEMASAGIREFLIHPCHGLQIEYLSQEYFQRVRFALDQARAHGLKVWIYDEYAWPSGTAGGRVLRDNPEYAAWILKFSQDEAGGISSEAARQDRVLDSAVGAPWSGGEAGYLDTLRPEAVAEFIRLTYQRTYEECKEYFGDVIAGFFTDEPTMMIGDLADGAGMWNVPSVPWTPQLPDLFKERFGYAIEPHYAELALDGPSDAKRDYWSLLKDMYAEGYHGQIARWCGDHGVKYTGHLFGEDHPINHTRFSGSMYECLKHMDLPGIDFLGCGKRPEDRFWEQVLVASVARHTGRDRVLCEAYGISPMDLRLGEMLRQAQMFGIHGVNDIALMCFAQESDGVRKRCYWPELFTKSPWWEFYAEFRDVCARSVSLVSLGRRRNRYALLYPQEQLEQTNVFQDCAAMTDPGSEMIRQVGLDVYESGETFDFIFPEILDQVRIKDGRIVMPHGDYDAIIAPSGMLYSSENAAQLERIANAGGRVIAETGEIRDASPSWSDEFTLKVEPSADSCRVYRFDYADGSLWAIRNVSDSVAHIEVTSDIRVAEWDPVRAMCIDKSNAADWSLQPFSTVYFSLSRQPLGVPQPQTALAAIDAKWTVRTERANTACLSDIQFRHPCDGWVDAVGWGYSSLYDTSGQTPLATTIPQCFAGETQIEMRGRFMCRTIDVCAGLGVLFEADHLDRLTVNGKEIDLSSAEPCQGWNDTCRVVDVAGAAVAGDNEISGTLRFAPWETSIASDGFLVSSVSMPACDIRMAGGFRLIDGGLQKSPGGAESLPIDFGQVGLAEYSGVAVLSAEVQVGSEPIVALEVDPVSEDAVEVLLDGISIGRCITRPYRFYVECVSPGRHELELRIASTSANVLEFAAPWGVRSVGWVMRDENL